MNIAKRIYLKLKYWKNVSSLFFARCCACFVNGKKVWLVAEKTDEARDNGYWFYRYLRTVHPEETAFYVISRASADYTKIAEFGTKNIIEPNSWKHKVWFWAAEYNTCSQPASDYFSGFRTLIQFKKKSQKITFLQHGIIKDNLSHGLDKDKSGIDIFITSAEREQKSVIERHGFDAHTCVLTGLCRYDNLPLENASRSRLILIMPTFRHWLPAKVNQYPSEADKEMFMKDEYCRSYRSLLYLESLNQMLEKYDYKVIFYPHYCAQAFLNCFDDSDRSDRVCLASSQDYDVQKLLIDADVLITDFSSVFFDFAYMKKPEIFYQFDEIRYRGEHYEEGYFKYRRDAFGPVFEREEDVIDYLDKVLANDARMEAIYEQRVNNFFAYTDKNNCERTYHKIVNFRR